MGRSLVDLGVLGICGELKPGEGIKLHRKIVEGNKKRGLKIQSWEVLTFKKQTK